MAIYLPEPPSPGIGDQQPVLCGRSSTRSGDSELSSIPHSLELMYTHIHSPICLSISQAFSAPCQLTASHSSGNWPGRIWGVCVTMIQYFHSYLAGHLCFFHSFALISTNRCQSQALCTAWERGKGNVENLSIHKCIQILRARNGLLDPISAFQRLINESLVSVCMFP